MTGNNVLLSERKFQSWRYQGFFFKISDEHPRAFHMAVPPLVHSPQLTPFSAAKGFVFCFCLLLINGLNRLILRTKKQYSGTNWCSCHQTSTIAHLEFGLVIHSISWQRTSAIHYSDHRFILLLRWVCSELEALPTHCRCLISINSSSGLLWFGWSRLAEQQYHGLKLALVLWSVNSSLKKRVIEACRGRNRVAKGEVLQGLSISFLAEYCTINLGIEPVTYECFIPKPSRCLARLI